MNDANGDLEALREQHLKRVYVLFAARSKSFRWTLFGLIGLAVVFFAGFAFPYITLQDEGVRIAERLDGLLASEMAANMAVEIGIDAHLLEQVLDRYLRSHLAELAEVKVELR